MKIIETYQTDPSKNYQGGGVRYVKNLFENLPPTVEKEFWGVNLIESGELKNIGRPRNSIGFIVCLVFYFCKYRPTKNQVHIIHTHRIYFGAVLKIFKCLLMKKNMKIVSTIHAETFFNLEQKLPKIFRSPCLSFVILLEQICFRLVDDFYFVSKRNRDFYLMRHKKLYTLINEKMIFPPMITENYGNTLKNRNEKKRSEETKFIMLGRLSIVKNYQYIIDFCNRNKNELSERNIKINIYGDGELYNELVEQTERLSLGNIIAFLGEISHKEVYAELKKSDGLILVSKNEAAPTVVIEALAAGTPVLTTDVGNVIEVLTHPSLGIVLPKLDDEVFFKGLLELPRLAPDAHCVKSILDKRSPKVISQGYLTEFLKCQHS